MQTMFRIFAVLLLPATLIGQARQFEVASIRPSADQQTQVTVGVSINGSQLRISYWTLKEYLAMAFGTRPDQVEGPDWIGQPRFDISAKLPDGASQDDVDEMMKALLIERFQMKVHTARKEFPVYALGVGNELKIHPVPVDPSAPAPSAFTAVGSGNANAVGIDFGGGATFSLANGRIEMRKMEMPMVADVLSRFMDRTVVDTTGLMGRYDLTLDLTPEDYTALRIRSAINAGVALPPQALRALDVASGNPLAVPFEKYGLRFESRRMPLDVLVVDSASRTPAEN